MKLEDFLTKEEGDDSRRLPDGRFASTYDRLGRCWNIGCGVTVGVTKDTVWTADELRAHEEAELASVVAGVSKLVKVPLGENRMTVLESFAYNCGLSAFASSSILKSVNAGKFGDVPAELRLYVHAKGAVGPVPGLIKRRNDEIRLWNHPDDVPPSADLKTPKNVPQALLSPTNGASIMADTPTVTVPVSSSNAVISPLVNNLLSAVTILTTFITSTGIDFTSLVSTISHGNFWAGLFATSAVAAVKHLVVQNSNSVTVAAIANAANSAAAVVSNVASAAQSVTASAKAATVNPQQAAS